MWNATRKAWDVKSCTVTSSTSDESTCECSSVSDFDSSSFATELFVDFAALSGSVGSQFLSTLNVHKTIDLATLVKNIVVFVTIGGSFRRRRN